MKCFDLHCDTLFRMHREGLSFDSPSLHLNYNTCLTEQRRIQAFALWADSQKDGEGAWRECVCLLRKHHSLSFLPRNTSGIFAIEDGKVLCGDLKRLTVLRKLGVRILTFFWKGENELGGGWNTECGLTPFGRRVLAECFRLGIIPDVSHASLLSAEEILSTARRMRKTAIASHGGAWSVCHHGRNLPDWHLKAVAQCGGLVGLTMVPFHLTESGDATWDHFAQHLSRMCDLGLGNFIAPGFDFDGSDSLPRGMRSAEDLPSLWDFLLEKGFSANLCHRFFWENGYKFVKTHKIIRL